ncbi:hypothetical protein [Sigmofec virus UA08Rod_6521]|uniref:Uncharacterized protein n=1 Tax=Sigmofec virus UA08Rod_6521 TaxID=2929233 RepID=A0A976N0Y0_9VIRU|nr:hypothetical protein [Sigmofec virus UA08Rod_6521]
MLDYLPIIYIVLVAVLNGIELIYSVRTGRNIKSEVNSMKKMVTLTDKSVAREKKDPYTQSFSPLIKQYRYNESSGELEELPDMLNIDKVVESCRQSCLEALKERFLPRDVTAELQGQVEDIERDIGDIASSLSALDDWREKLNLSPESSTSQVYEAMMAEREKMLKDAQMLQEKHLDDRLKAAQAQPLAGPTVEQIRAQIAALQASLDAQEKGGVENA